LYWIALLSLILVFGIFSVNPGNVAPYNLSFTNLIIHFLGLQGIFSDFSLQSMWFVGVIVLFFLVYPIIMFFSKNSNDILIFSTVFFLLFYITHVFSGLISINFLIYFPVFISGILVNRITLIENNNFKMIVVFLGIFCDVMVKA